LLPCKLTPKPRFAVERLMTSNTLEVAVCCSNDSERAGARTSKMSQDASFLSEEKNRGVGQAQRHQSKAMAFSNIVLIGSTST
jgi:hypothetical protein